MKLTIADELIFGFPKPNVEYTDRRAVYVVILGDDGQVAMVKSKDNYFLPGGGSLPDEAPEDTVLREVDEELRRRVRLIRRIGEATQYFYSATDERHYKMQALFFAGELTDEAHTGAGEHELQWMPIGEAERVCFHACHGWAIHQA